jgi:hypothetical protein
VPAQRRVARVPARRRVERRAQAQRPVEPPARVRRQVEQARALQVPVQRVLALQAVVQVERRVRPEAWVRGAAPVAAALGPEPRRPTPKQ